MTTQTAKVKYTYEDYMRTPDDVRYELLDGELILSPSPRTAHQRTSRDIFMPLTTFIEENQLGEVFIAPFDVVLDNFNVVQPDILFVSNERAHIITDLNIQGAPDIPSVSPTVNTPSPIYPIHVLQCACKLNPYHTLQRRSVTHGIQYRPIY